MTQYEVVVIGASAGGMVALATILPGLSADFPLPVSVVQHLHPEQDMENILNYYNAHSSLTVKEAQEKERLRAGYVYIAPPDYHLLIEDDWTFSLSVDARVNYCRPSINVLFESAADAYRAAVIGLILSGANDDGASGLRTIKQQGGLTIVQDPATAESPFMPRAALDAVEADYVVPLEEIALLLIRFGENEHGREY